MSYMTTACYLHENGLPIITYDEKLDQVLLKWPGLNLVGFTSEEARKVAEAILVILSVRNEQTADALERRTQ